MKNVFCLLLWIALFASNLFAMGSKHLEYLPQELYQEVVRYLAEDDKKSISLLSKLAYQWLAGNIQELVLRQPKGERIAEPNWSIYFSHLVQLRSLRIKNNTERLRFKYGPFSHLTALKRLDLKECSELNAQGLLKMVSSLRRLEELQFPPISSDEHVQAISLLTTLNKLVLHNSCRISDDVLLHLSDLPNMKALHLYGGINLKHLSLIVGLKELSCFLNQAINCADLSKATDLEKLTLYSCNALKQDAIQWLLQLSNLKEFRFSSTHSVTDTSTYLSHICHLTNLTKLNLKQCWNLTDQGICHLSNLTNLKELDLSCNLFITKKGVQHLSTLTGLKKLDLSNCTQLTPEVLNQLTALCGLSKSSLSRLN